MLGCCACCYSVAMHQGATAVLETLLLVSGGKVTAIPAGHNLCNLWFSFQKNCRKDLRKRICKVNKVMVFLSESVAAKQAGKTR